MIQLFFCHSLTGYGYHQNIKEYNIKDFKETIYLIII